MPKGSWDNIAHILQQKKIAKKISSQDDSDLKYVINFVFTNAEEILLDLK